MPVNGLNPVGAAAAAAASERAVVRRATRKEKPRVRPADELVVGADAVESGPLAHVDDGKGKHEARPKPKAAAKQGTRLDVAG